MILSSPYYDNEQDFLNRLFEDPETVQGFRNKIKWLERVSRGFIITTNRRYLNLVHIQLMICYDTVKLMHDKIERIRYENS